VNRLLENAFKNRFKGNIYEQVNDSDIVDMPIEVEDAGWEQRQDDQKFFLFRSYTISDIKLLKYFVGEIILMGSKYNHPAEIYIYDDVVEVQLYTQGMNDISHTDIKMSKDIDAIINDINILTQEK
jgi:pterin-4a-carbinolamine dehydratase|tara:strand:+ start:8903 stop:9280 length:378 start_codon:yes stop_codon:yes gene_type:complete